MMSYSVQILVGASLLLLAALVVSTIARRKSASLQYRILHTVVPGLLLLPILAIALPQQTLGLIPFSFDTFKPRSTSSQAAPSPHYLTEDIQYFPPGIVETQENAVLPPVLEHTPIPPTVAPEVVAEVAPEIAPERQSGLSLSSIAEILIACWFVGTCILLLRLCFSLIAARRLLRRTMPVEDESLRTLTRELAQNMGLRRSVALLQSEAGTVPFTLGIRRPKIILPRTAVESRSESQLRAILTHELAHVKRGDVRGQLLIQLAFCLYWFHPLLWLAVRQIRVSRELACDDMVLLNGETPADFATTLLELADTFSTGNRLALGCGVAIFERKNIVRQRIASILNKKASRVPVGRVGGVVLLLFAIVGVTLASVVSPFENFDGVEYNMRKLRLQLETLSPTPAEKTAITRLRQNIYDDYNSKTATQNPAADSRPLEESHDDTVTMTFRILTLKEPFGEAMLAHKAMEWTGLPVPVDSPDENAGRLMIPNQKAETKPGLCSLMTTAPLPLHVRFMEKENVHRLLGITQGNSYANTLQAPRGTLLSGETLNVCDTVERYFVTSVIPVEGDYAIAYQPVIQAFTEGVSINCRATMLEDHSCRLDSCAVEFTSIDDEVATVTLRDEWPGPGIVNDVSQNGISVQIPSIRSYSISIPEIAIPENMSMLVAIPGISKMSGGDSMFLLVTPCRIESPAIAWEHRPR